jgi:hypothetical protein
MLMSRELLDTIAYQPNWSETEVKALLDTARAYYHLWDDIQILAKMYEDSKDDAESMLGMQLRTALTKVDE